MAPFSVLETKGEPALCVQFRTWLTKEEHDDRCTCVWFHPQNESNQVGNQRWWNLQRNMGKFAGVSDYVFMGDKINLCLEIKDGPKGKQSEAQSCFEQWCNKKKVPYELARTLDEAIKFVRQYGVIQSQ